MQVIKGVDAKLDKCLENFIQLSSNLEEHILQFSGERTRYQPPDIKEQPLDSATSIDSNNARFHQKSPETETQLEVDVSLAVATPNRFTGNVRVSYVNFEERDTGGYKKTIALNPPFEEPSQEEAGIGTPTLTFSTWKDERGKWTRTEIEIKSKKLLEFLKTFLEDLLIHDSLLSRWGEESVTLTAEQIALWKLYEDLKRISEGEESIGHNIDKETREELKCLIVHVEQFEATHVQMRRSAEKMSEVAAERLWTLFPVGTEVVAKPFADMEQIFIVKDFWYTPDAQSSLVSRAGPEAILECWCYDWDGLELTKSTYHLPIPKMGKPKSILELPYYPLKYHPDKDGLREKLIKRGKRFKDLCLPFQQDYQLVECTGPVIQGPSIGRRGLEDTYELYKDNSNFHNRPPWHGSAKDKFDIIIDAATFIRDVGVMMIGTHQYKSKQTCECKFCKLTGSQDWEQAFKYRKGNNDTASGVDDEKYENFFSLLPPRALGVMVKQKKFAQFPIDQISAVDSKDFEAGWNRLQLDNDHKLALKHMVAAQLERKPQEESQEQTIIRDLVPGKGKGLVILLHGKQINVRFQADTDSVSFRVSGHG
jgi:hypothetical protein